VAVLLIWLFSKDDLEPSVHFGSITGMDVFSLFFQLSSVWFSSWYVVDCSVVSSYSTTCSYGCPYSNVNFVFR
jgi:hypothetical protein